MTDDARLERRCAALERENSELRGELVEWRQRKAADDVEQLRDALTAALRIRPGAGRVLQYLIDHAGKACAKEAIVRWSARKEDAGDKLADVEVSYIRRALRQRGLAVEIHTVRCCGYLMPRESAAILLAHVGRAA
jgi:DNA-binding response OmpR family regulator